MRKIALIGMVLLAAASVGCSNKSQQGTEEQAAPAPATQEAAPAQQSGTGTMDNQAAPAPAPAPAPGNDQGASQGNAAPSAPQGNGNAQ